jgi:hypothetical protein
MYGPDVVWMLNSLARDIPRWLIYNSTRKGQIVPCSEKDIRTAASGAFMFERQLIREDSNRTASGLVSFHCV